MIFLNYINKAIKAYFFDDEALDYIDDEVNWKTAFLSVWSLNILLTSLIMVLSIIFSTEKVLNDFLNVRQEYVSIFLSIVLYPIGAVIGLGIVHLLLKLFGGKGTFTNTFKYGLSITVFPLIYFNLLLMLFILFPSFEVGLGGLYLISGIIFFFWNLSIIFKVYSAIQQISKWRVFFALILIPFLIILVLGIFIGIFVSSTIESDFDIGSDQRIEKRSSLSVERLQNGIIYVKNSGDEIEPLFKVSVEEKTTGCFNSILKYLNPGVNAINLSCSSLIVGNMYEVTLITTEGNLVSRNVVN